MVAFSFEFQFTHPRGVRFFDFIKILDFHSFNSRTREGCDNKTFCRHSQNNVSIHAPARGAIWLLLLAALLLMFQFTHPRGVRFVLYCGVQRLISFNSRTREGCDPKIRLCENNEQVSIHAPARGAILNF